MITTTQPLANAMLSEGIACSNQTKNVTPKDPDTAIDFCLCSTGCDYTELAFSDPGGEAYKNDTSSFLIDMIDAAGTFSFFLELKGVKIPLIDDTYGQYFGFGELEQAQKVGYIVDWAKVYTESGPGVYKFIAEIVEFGVEITQESHYFRATRYSPQQADGTIRLKTINSGTIINGVDYSGMRWPRSIRIDAQFLEQAPELEQIEGLNSQRQPVQVQLSMRGLARVETGLIPGYIYDLLNGDIKAQIIYVDNYDIFAFSTTRNRAMVLQTIDELDTNYRGKDVGRFTFTLKDYNLQLKRNV